MLVVDDDALQLRAIQRTVRSNKQIALATADNAIDAMLQIGAMKPDLVVMDVYMPGLDGVEACKRIRSNPETRHVEVILTSAHMTEELEARATAAGANRVAAKPVDLAGLVASMQTGPVEAEAAATQSRGADVLVTILQEAGVEVVFGLPGGAISPVHDALMDSNIRVVTARHEAGAMFAAAGYAHGTGRLGVVAVTSGPGFLNAMTGLASAWCDGLPVVLLVGEVPRAAHGKGVLQDGSSHGLQIIEMARHVTKMAAEVARPSALPHMLRRAVHTALSGRKGPVVLTLPLDVTTATIASPRIEGSINLGSVLPPATLAEVAELLLTAERPLIVAGSGMRVHGAPAKLRTVAERLSCPVVTTPKAKGVFPENHPLSLGVIGLGGHPSAKRYLESAPDVVVAIGTSLGDTATDGFSPYLQGSRAMVHVDIDARQIGKSYAPTHAVVAPAAEFLNGLLENVGERTTRRLVAAGVERHKLPSSNKVNRIAPHDALLELQQLLPADTIYTVDSGEHFLFATHYLETTRPDSFVVMTGLGSMGQSIGAAIGAQLAHPERTVAAICGDGCFAMNAFEVATAVVEKLPIRVFVFNDERLGMVEKGHESVYGRRPEYTTKPLDVCSIARGLGAATIRIDGIGQLREAAQLLRETEGPVVVDVQLDHEISLPKKDRIGNLVPSAPSPTTPAPRSDRRPQVVN